ncbi:MAG: phospholipase D family protein [Syntrophorhabdales bacterium]|jgi:phosphatidylserine/phosphatidylglycerophosphate/cardiolipin synthase-like enzyme
MNRRVIALFVLLALFFPAVNHADDLTLINAPTRVYFSPNGGATQAIVREIDNATLEVLVQAYLLNSAPIAKALVNAHKRGVSVEAILDKSREAPKYTGATFLANNKIPTYIDAEHAIAHSKVMIIDKQTVITGSFNFTKASEEKNAENLLIIRSEVLASYYLDNWQKHRQHSKRYQGKY